MKVEDKRPDPEVISWMEKGHKAMHKEGTEAFERNNFIIEDHDS